MSDSNETSNSSGMAQDENHLPMVDKAKIWIKNGFEIFLLPLYAGKKNPCIDDWPNYVGSRKEILTYAKKNNNLGLRTGAIVAVDIEEGPLNDGIYQRVMARWPTAPTRTRQGTNSKAVILRASDLWSSGGFSAAIGDGAKKVVEILGYGRQLHIEGTRDDAGGVVLEWDKRPDFWALPEVSPDELVDLLEEAKQFAVTEGYQVVSSATTGTGASGTGAGDECSEKELEGLVALIPNDGRFDDYHEALKVGMAIAQASSKSELGQRLWEEWCAQRDQDPETWPQDKWRSFKEGDIRVGAQTLRDLAFRFDPDGYGKLANQIAQDTFDIVPIEDERDDKLKKNWKVALRKLRSAKTEVGQDQASSLAAAGKFTVISKGTTLPKPYVTPEVADLYVRGELTTLVADPGAGKSTLTTLYAVALCWDRPDLVGLQKFDWTGDFIYVSNEDGLNRFQQRFMAMLQEFGLDTNSMAHNVYFLNERLTLVGKASQRGAVEVTQEAIDFVLEMAKLRENAANGLAVVVVDTLASAAGGSEENSTPDMQMVMNVGVDVALAGFCAFNVIHHVRKETSSTHRSGDSVKRHRTSRITLASIRGASAIGGSVRRAHALTAIDDRMRDLYDWTGHEMDSVIALYSIKGKVFPDRFFEFKRVSIPVDDPRDLTLPATEEVDILVHVPTPPLNTATKQPLEERVKTVLDLELADGGEMLLGERTGPLATASAVGRCLKELGLSKGSDRGAVLDAIEEMVRSGMFKDRTAFDKHRHPKRYISRGAVAHTTCEETSDGTCEDDA